MNNGTVIVNNLRQFITDQLDRCDESIAELIIDEVNTSFDSISAHEQDDFEEQLLDMLVEFDNEDVPGIIRTAICDLIAFYED